jgi:hypothetical protein
LLVGHRDLRGPPALSGPTRRSLAYASSSCFSP